MGSQTTNTLWKRLILVFTLIAVLGIVSQFLYIISHDFNRPARSQVTTITQIKILERLMLIWTLAVLVIVRLFVRPRIFTDLINQEFSMRVISKWALSAILFEICFRVFLLTKKNFDPSSHLFCAFLDLSSLLSMCILISNYRDYYSRNCVIVICVWSGLMLIYRSYSMYFTCYIYHTIFENIHALGSAYIVILIVFIENTFTDELYWIVRSFINVKEVRNHELKYLDKSDSKIN